MQKYVKNSEFLVDMSRDELIQKIRALNSDLENAMKAKMEAQDKIACMERERDALVLQTTGEPVFSVGDLFANQPAVQAIETQKRNGRMVLFYRAMIQEVEQVVQPSRIQLEYLKERLQKYEANKCRA